MSQYVWICLNNNGMASPLANGPLGSELSWAVLISNPAVKSLEPGIESIMEVVHSWADEEFEDRNHYRNHYFATTMEPRNPKIRNWKRCCQIFFHCLRWTNETTNLDQISGSFPLSISRNRKSLTRNCLWLHAPYVPLWEFFDVAHLSSNFALAL